MLIQNGKRKERKNAEQTLASKILSGNFSKFSEIIKRGNLLNLEKHKLRNLARFGIIFFEEFSLKRRI